MSIAFCFLTIADLSQPRLWDAFLDKAHGAKTYFHPKFPHQIKTALIRNNIIDHIIPTSHGDVSLVEATLNLLSAAFHDDVRHEHFVLLSDTTIPIAPFKRISEELSLYQNRSVMDFSIGAPGSEHFNRQQFLPPSCVFTPFFSHSQWITLTRRHVERLLTKPGLECFKEFPFADEHYFLNVLIHACGVDLSEVINARKTFVNWRDREVRETFESGRLVSRTIHPKTYSSLPTLDVTVAIKNGCWFFRKVSHDCDTAHLMDSVAS